MNIHQLLPIVRRVRRPLTVTDLPATVVGNVEPVQVQAETTDHGQQTTGPGQELGNIEHPTSNTEPRTEEAVEAGTTNEGDAATTTIPAE